MSGRSPFVSVSSWIEPGKIIQATEPIEVVTGNAASWQKLATVLKRYQCKAAHREYSQGAALGYFTYEGDFWFGFFPQVGKNFDHGSSPLWKKAQRNWRKRKNLHKKGEGDKAISWESNCSKEAFISRVKQAQESIQAGDIYQVNLSQRLSTAFLGDPYGLFEQLTLQSPAPGSAFLDTGSQQILCSSPELFLKIQGREVTTRPIKGTRPRGKNPNQDEQLAQQLLNDPKELAELIMITDLERNDLGSICDYGSISVPELATLEPYAQVFHLVSTVKGVLRSEINALAALRACFPGGSITGAPKKRAIEIITDLEKEPRGVYTGAIGYFTFQGDASFTIAIRTMEVNEMAEEASFSVGSGITAGSDPEREYEETLHKAAGMKLAMQAYLRQQGNTK